MCGEKQSIKRHYGLGNGQECRLHVQKLNALRGKTEEEILCKKNEDSEDEPEIEQNKIVHTIKQFERSKWSTHIYSDDMIQDEAVIVDLSDEKVFSPIPQKRKKSDGFANKHSLLTQEACVNDKVSKTPYKQQTTNSICKESKHKFSQDIPSKINHTILKANNVQGTVQRKSKWAHFVEDNKVKTNEMCCSENVDINKTQQRSSDNGQKFFEQCDDNDLDAILYI